MKRPKTFYRYNTHQELEKHKVSKECVPYVSIPETSEYGQVWRCRHDYNFGGGANVPLSDFSGYDNMLDAQKEAVQQTQSLIYNLECFVEELDKKIKNKTKQKEVSNE